MKRHNIPGFINWFIPKDISSDRWIPESGKLSEALIMCVTIIGINLIVMVCSIGLYFIFRQIADPSYHFSLTIVFLINGALYIIGLFYIKHSNTTTVSAHIFAVAVYVGVMNLSYYTGGMWLSPISLVFVLVPMWAFLMTTFRGGIFWSVLILASLIVFYALDRSGMAFPQVLPTENYNEIKLFAWLFSTIIVIICVLIYHRNYIQIYNQIEEERLGFAHEALHDTLTGLANRKLFNKRAKKAIDFALEENLKGAILYIDLDNFKPINDRYGHLAGDSVLKIITKRVTASVRSSDTVSRLGGDEFAIILHGIKGHDIVSRICEDIQNTLQDPINVNEKEFNLTGSIGVVVFPDRGVEVDSLIRLADKAMYKAKEKKNTVCFG